MLLLLQRGKGKEMERFTVTASSNGRLPGRPIMEGDQAPLPFSSFPLKPQLRDPSFSTYLSPEEPKPILQKPIDRQLAEEINEISIFDAKRYFNEGQEQKGSDKNTNASPVTTNLDNIVESHDIPAIQRFSSEGYGRKNCRTRSFHATPTASSEASWNSQSGLLSNPPGSIAVSMRNLRVDDKRKGGSWLSRRKCPCSGKKSVQVEEKFSEPKTRARSSSISFSNSSSLNHRKHSSKAGEVQLLGGIEKAKAPSSLYEKRLGVQEEEEEEEKERVAKVKLTSTGAREQTPLNTFSPETHFTAEIGHRVVSSSRSFKDAAGGFSFPILNPPVVAGKLGGSQLEDPSRESLEVFRLSDDSIGRSFNFPKSPRARPTTATVAADDDNDMMSDASSDLFEIESFSTQSTMYPMYRRRDSLDEMSSVDGRSRVFLGSECYEPSEASIEWSVTTAEGFDRASATNMSISASDFEEMRSEGKKGEGGGGRRKGNGGLLSCRCEKAVNVGPHPVRYLAEPRRFGPSHPVESARIQAPPILPPASTLLPLAHSHSARIYLSTR